VFVATSMASGTIVLVGAVFLASSVEMVEALTIVLAVGHTRGWRSAFEGSAVALVVLAALVSAFGPALVHVPLNILRLVVGGVLLIFGMQWLRKSILRATGLKAKHDEDAIYEETVAALRAEGATPGRDRIAFVMAFKGVFLEGLEVIILVITLGTSAHQLGLAAIVAAAAVVLVAMSGAIVAKQLSNVPENALKMSVGVLLVTYGTFWTGEGLRVRWPGGDTMLLGLATIYAVVTWLFVVALRRDLATSLKGATA
jgi:Ca2+/H+ antiporter, TMEM165/GDT1 family